MATISPAQYQRLLELTQQNNHMLTVLYLLAASILIGFALGLAVVLGMSIVDAGIRRGVRNAMRKTSSMAKSPKY